MYGRVCLAAGLPGRIPPDFGRTAVRNLERADVSLSVAMELIGHRTESVYHRYDIVAERDLPEVILKVHCDAGGEKGKSTRRPYRKPVPHIPLVPSGL